jgi:hypothetical protein
LGNLGLNGRIILKWIFKKLNQVIDWIDLVQLSLCEALIMESELFPEIYGLITAMSDCTLTLYVRLVALEISGFKRVLIFKTVYAFEFRFLKSGLCWSHSK